MFGPWFRNFSIDCNETIPQPVLLGMNLNAPSTDREIKQALVTHRDAGFTMLVVRFQPGIYSGARRLTHRHEDAEEVAQETFLRAYRALGGYDDRRISNLKLSGWLWTIAINLCRDRASGRRRPIAIDTRLAASGADAPPIDAAAWNERLARLSTDQRTAVVLRHVADLSIADISEIVGRPQGTVRADISRGLDHLRDVLAREETP